LFQKIIKHCYNCNIKLNTACGENSQTIIGIPPERRKAYDIAKEKVILFYRQIKPLKLI